MQKEINEVRKKCGFEEEEIKPKKKDGGCHFTEQDMKDIEDGTFDKKLQNTLKKFKPKKKDDVCEYTDTFGKDKRTYNDNKFKPKKKEK